jgi:hypothetical protein
VAATFELRLRRRPTGRESNRKRTRIKTGTANLRTQRKIVPALAEEANAKFLFVAPSYFAATTDLSVP